MDKSNPNSLNEPDAAARIQNVRANSTLLPELRKQLRELLAGQSCLVIGSAPGPTWLEADRYICVNGSGWSAARMRITVPDLTVLAGWSLLPNQDNVRTKTMEVLRGLQTKTLLFAEMGCDEAYARCELNRLGYSYETFLKVNPIERAVILGDAAGEDIPTGKGTGHNKRPSNGMFGVALALWAGAQTVAMTGFSLDGGHAYIEGETPRHHQEGDRWFQERVCSRIV